MNWAWHDPWMWANRIGMVMCFMSFWFAAPELFGEEKIKELVRLSRWIPAVLIAAVVVVFICRTIPEDIKFYSHGLVSMRAYYIQYYHHLGSKLLSTGLLALIFPVVIGLLIALTNYVTNNRDRRIRSLKIAAILFVVGSFLQLAATFEPPVR